MFARKYMFNHCIHMTRYIIIVSFIRVADETGCYDIILLLSNRVVVTAFLKSQRAFQCSHDYCELIVYYYADIAAAVCVYTTTTHTVQQYSTTTTVMADCVCEWISVLQCFLRQVARGNDIVKTLYTRLSLPVGCFKIYNLYCAIIVLHYYKLCIIRQLNYHHTVITYKQ